jgi:hypothetical protein
MAFDPTKRIFKIGGYDVSKWVLSLVNAFGVFFKPEWGGMPETPRLEFELTNSDNQFSSFSEISIFFGKQVQDIPLEVIYRQGSTDIIEWDGFVENVIEDLDRNIVKIIGVSKFQKKLDLPALLSSTITTPAHLSETVFALYGIDTDSTSYSRSKTALTNLVTAQIDPNLVDSNINLYELQKLLATAGYARIYPDKGKMKYEVFNTSTPTVSISLGEKDLLTDPQSAKEERQGTFYKVDYIDGFEDSSGFTSGATQQNLNFGLNSAVKITSSSAALQVADQWEAISNLEAKRISFGVKPEVGYYLSLDSYITLTLEDLNLNNQTLEIVGIDRTDDRYTMITGRTI